MEEARFETKVVHAGIEPEERTGAVMTPIFQTSTYAQSSPGIHRGYEYSRTDNPTRSVLQTQLAALEGGEHALVFASGLSAIDAVLNLLKQGDHVVAGKDLYGGSLRLFNRVAINRGISFSFVDLNDGAALNEAFTPVTRLVWCESPTNPMMNVVDLATIARIAHEHGAMAVVDNTFMSPYFQRPLGLGCDLVMHSATKYLNGHSDVIMGALIMRDRDLFARLKFLQNAIGAVPGPQDCFLVLRGIKTLAIRMQRHAENASVIAKFLEGHPKVERVLYPGLPSHPNHELAGRQMSGFGGMITFLLRGGLPESKKFLESVKLFTLAESLGGVESLIEHPAIMTHASVPQEVRASVGIEDNLVRLSVGIEAVEDLVSDLEQALAAI
jgi:cystathionine gamma-lyase